MARFDVYRMRSSSDLVLDVQADLLNNFNTRIVIPLYPKEHAPAAIRRLNPEFEIDGVKYLLLTQWLGAVALNELGEICGHLAGQHDQITGAVDMVFQGF